MSVRLSSTAGFAMRGPALRPAPAPRFASASHVLEAGKQDPTTPAFKIYLQDMARNASKKARFFAEHLNGLSVQGSRTVVDIGCCTGDMIRELEKLVPATRFVGMDLNIEMLRVFNQKDHEAAGPGKKAVGRCFAADGFELPIARNSVAAFTLSSLMHEIYSYAEPSFSEIKLGEFFDQLHGALKPGGRVIIRDPGKPPNPNERLTIEALPDPSLKSPETLEEIMATHPGELAQDALLRRFIHQFKPAEGLVRELGPNKYEMPAWVVSEFLRHRRLNDTIEHWDSEMREQYGVFTEEQMKRFALDHGFLPITVESAFDPKNHSVGYEGEYRIQHADGTDVDQETRFPTHMYTVLQKPANLGETARVLISTVSFTGR